MNSLDINPARCVLREDVPVLLHKADIGRYRQFCVGNHVGQKVVCNI